MDPLILYIVLPALSQVLILGLVLWFLEGRARVAALLGLVVLWGAGMGWFKYSQNYQPPGYALEVALSGVNHPTGAIFLPDGRMLVTEKTGTIQISDGDHVRDAPFVDLSDRVSSSTSEEGLLSIAVSPDFPSDARLFAYYSAEEGTVTRLTSLPVDLDGSRADAASEKVLLEIPQPETHHNGGQLQFGPDGMLYLSVGEGGTTTPSPAQDPSNLLGSLLRLDVSDPDVPYTVPPDNPFVGEAGVRPEIFAVGLRNPWRYDFADDGRFFVADVGRDKLEEINAVDFEALKGANFGWDHYEASLALRDGAPDDLVFPVHEYSHLGFGGCSVIGGRVYRGSDFPAIRGAFVFADFCNGTVSALQKTEAGYEPQRILKLRGQLTSFAQDAAGELYVVIINADEIYRVVPDHSERASNADATSDG